jgi:hypothetical protein
MTAYRYCAICKKHNLVVPLHGTQGGPEVCLVCAGKWHAEHGRRRRAGRVVIRALRAYEEAGGKWHDFDKLKLSAIGQLGFMDLDPLGYMADAINTDVEIVDLTSELLDDAIHSTRLSAPVTMLTNVDGAPSAKPKDRQPSVRHAT